jgi:hypothetical protein
MKSHDFTTATGKRPHDLRRRAPRNRGKTQVVHLSLAHAPVIRTGIMQQ